MKELSVYFDGAPMGTLSQNRGGQNSFTYAQAWLDNPSATPLSNSMPLKGEEYRNKKVDNFLWGLLPDNEVVIGRWAAQFKVSTGNPFGLLANVGRDVAGAVTFMDSEYESGGGLLPIGDSEIAERIDSIHRDPAAWSTPANGQFSLAGAQGKFALRRENGKWHEPFGDEPTTHIFKPRMQGLSDQEINEHLSLKAAKKLGLTVATSSVERFGDHQAIVLERYDRVVKDGQVRRLHQEDLCQALGIHPRSKYQMDGGPGAVASIQLIRKVSSNPEVDTESFVRALAYNYAIWGTDAHAKNYSLLLSGNDVDLAPLYDVNSYLPYMTVGPDAKPVKAAMNIGDEYRFRSMRKSHWQRLAEKVGLDPDWVVGVVRDTVNQAPDAMAEAVADEPDLSTSSTLPAKLSALVAKRSKLQDGDDIWPGVRPPATYAPQARGGETWVAAHTRSGRPVEGHWRAAPTKA